MGLVEYNQIFNKNTIVVFTDGSIHTNKISRRTYSSSANIVVHGNDVFYSEPLVLKNSTNNIGELIAIYEGINNACKLYYNLMQRRINVTDIYLFSDSKYCIDGLTAWLTKWVNNQQDKKLINYARQPVVNQHIFQIIIRLISQTKIPIRLFKMRGHMEDYYNEEKIQKNINKLRDYLHFNNYNVLARGFCSDELVKTIADFNSKVDHMAYDSLKRFRVSENIDDSDIQYSNLLFPIHYMGIQPFQLHEYFDIIKYYG